MSAVIILISRRGEHKDGLILGNPQYKAVMTDEDLDVFDSNSSPQMWVDSGLDIIPQDSRRSGLDGGRLVVVLTRTNISIAQTTLTGDPDDVTEAPVPIPEEGYTCYSCLLHPDTRKIWVLASAMPEEEPTQPWWRAFWPF